MLRSLRAALAATTVVVVLVGCAALPAAPEPPSGQTPTATIEPDAVDPDAVDPPPALTVAELESLSSLRIFFAHRSVGADIIELGLPAVYQELDTAMPTVAWGVPVDAGSFGEVALEQTEDPQVKVDDFDGWMRLRGVGDVADIAFMKLGYIDITPETNVQSLFDMYRTVMDLLESDYPDVRFLHVTVSVTAWDPAGQNVAIEKFNTLMRAHYSATGRLFDLAKTVYTCADGHENAYESEQGDPYHRICDEYTRDGGHLSDEGARVAAAEMLRMLAAAVA